MTRRAHRPYQTPGGERAKSITSIIGLLDKPGLPWAAANETAEFAILHQDEWAALPFDDAYDRLRKHHRGVWDGRAAMGTLVHAVAEAWADGRDADLPPLIDEVQSQGRIWQRMTADEVLVEANGYIDGLEAWWSDWQPAPAGVEEVVRHNGQNAYIGTCDLRAEIAGKTYRVDYKTSGKLDDSKGIYPDSWRLQLAALRYADEIVRYDGTVEVGVEQNPPVDACGIVLLRGDGRYTFFDVEAGGVEHNRFLQLCGIWDWLASVRKNPGVSENVPERLLAASSQENHK